MFPIKNLGRKLKIDLVSHKNALHPQYIQHFIQTMKEEMPVIANQSYMPPEWDL